MSQHEKEIKDEMRVAVDNVLKSRTGVAPASGCCYLQRGMVRECFNGLSLQDCENAAAACGCNAQYVPNCICS
jgi:hypothetical protein